MEHDVVKLVVGEQPMATHGRVLGRDPLQRAPGEVGGEDDVHDVFTARAVAGRDRVDERDGAFERQLLADAELLAELPPGSSQYSRPGFS
jgi:hypothetical protein